MSNEVKKPRTAAEAIGIAVGVIVVGLAGVLIASGLVWCIVTVWRAI